MKILHVTADHPDPFEPVKTPAIRNLLAITPALDHVLYSINRRPWPGGIAAMDFDGGARAVSYGAPGRGIFLREGLNRLADWIAEDCLRRGVAPDLIHGHKLTIEGIVAERLSRRLGAPYVVSVQAKTDRRLLAIKRDLRELYRRIWRGAAGVAPFAPAALDAVEAVLGRSPAPVTLLPCPTEIDEIRAPAITGSGLARTAFHLAGRKVKNADRMIRAAGLARARHPGFRFEIAGGGGEGDARAIARAAARHGGGAVAAIGPVARGDMRRWLGAAACVALVSRRESYGMAAAEALLAGAPIVVSEGWGLAGWFDDEGVALSAPAGDVDAIAEAFLRLTREEGAFKTRLAALQASGGLEPLRRRAIAAAYEAMARAAVAPPSIERIAS